MLISGYCAQCGTRCGTVAEVRDGRLVAVRPDREHPNSGFCVKGQAAPEIVYNEGRLKYPLKRTKPKTASDPGWVRISWEEALQEAAQRLLELKRQSGPETVAFTRPSPSGSSANDWAPWLMRLANAFGSPNFITTSHICQWGRDKGSVYTYGVGLPTPHFEEARAILIWGHNPAVSNVQTWQRIRRALRRGATLFVVDPRRTTVADHAHHWLAPKPGTDLALLLGLIRYFMSEGLYDREFVRFWTNGPFLVNVETGRFLRGTDGIDGAGDGGAGKAEYVVWDRQGDGPRGVNTALHPGLWQTSPQLQVAREIRLPGGVRVPVKSAFQLLWESVEPFTLERAADMADVPVEQLRNFARALGSIRPLCYYTYNGVEQHVNSAQTNRALCILYSLTGCFDAPGGNVIFPQVPTHRIEGAELLPPAQKAKRLGLDERPLGAPRDSAQAYQFYRAVLSGKPYPVRGLVSFGANPLLQHPDTLQGRAALEKLAFHLHVDIFENPSARFADILLPAATSWESPALAVTFRGGPATISHVQYRQPVIEPLHEARPDLEIVFDLAVRLGLGEHFWDGDVEQALRCQLEPSGLSLEELKKKPKGITVVLPQRFKKYAQRIGEGNARGFNTPTKKIEIYSERFLEHGYAPVPVYAPPAWQRKPAAGGVPGERVILTSAKVTQYCHSQGRGIPSLRRQAPEPYAQIHPDTAARFGLADGDAVFLRTEKGRIKVSLRVTDRIRPDVVAAQTGWWEGCEELGLPSFDPFSPDGANICLIMGNELLDPISGSVPVKSYPCTIERAR